MDKYYSNLCLQIVSDPDAMIRDCFRVLKPGASASFSVWGRPEVSPLMTLLGNTLRKLNIPTEPSGRSMFHMGGDNIALRNRFLNAGFSRCVIWPQNIVAPLNVDDAMQAITCPPSVQRLLALHKDHKDQILAELERSIRELLDNGEPIALECLIIAVTK